MDNNRDRRHTNFENDLQTILTDYLTRNLRNIINTGERNEEENTESSYVFGNNTHRDRQNRDTQDNYLCSMRDILNSIDRSMTTYQHNMSVYLNTMNRMLNNLHNYHNNNNNNNVHGNQPMFHQTNTRNVPYRNVPINTFNTSPNINPLRPSQNIRTNTTQPMRYDHILTYTIPPGINGLFGGNTNEVFNNLFQNVVVRPSEEQIERASQQITYDSSMNLINHRCPISLAEFEEGEVLRKLRFCGHTFTELSFTEWFHSNVRCPVCRHDIRDISDNGINENENSETDDEQEEGLHTDMSFNFHLNTNSNTNLVNMLAANIQTLLDPSSNLGFRLEIPIQFSEVYDMSDNLISRNIL